MIRGSCVVKRMSKYVVKYPRMGAMSRLGLALLALGAATTLGQGLRPLTLGTQATGTTQPAPTSDPATTAPVAKVWESYVSNPLGHPNLPNVSYAGYMYGEKPIPEPSTEKVFNVRSYGAVGDGVVNDSLPLLLALAAARQAGGGTVYLPAGVYLTNALLWLDHDGLRLRGDGPGKTVLKFTRSVPEVVGDEGGTNMETDKFVAVSPRWSWSGGLIRISPSRSYLSDVVGQSPQPERVAVAGSWAEGADTVSVTTPVAWLRPGQAVVLVYVVGSKAVTALGGFPEADWTAFAAWFPTGKKTFRMRTEVQTVKGTTVTFRKPLVVPGTADANLTIENPLQTIQQSGVEHLTLQMPTHVRPGHMQDPGFNAIYLKYAQHCWVRNVVIINADNGIIMEDAANNTLAGVTMDAAPESFTPTTQPGQKPAKPYKFGMHHAYSLRTGSCDNLITDFTVTAQVMHGLSMQDFANGNVFRKGTMAHGTFDSHRGLPFDNVRTDIAIHVDGTPGGDSDSGPFQGRRCVNWNVRVTTNPEDRKNRAQYIVGSEYYPQGALVGIQGKPENYTAATRPWAMPAGIASAAVEATGQEPNPADVYVAQWALRVNDAVQRQAVLASWQAPAVPVGPDVPVKAVLSNSLARDYYAWMTDMKFSADPVYSGDRYARRVEFANQVAQLVSDQTTSRQREFLELVCGEPTDNALFLGLNSTEGLETAERAIYDMMLYQYRQAVATFITPAERRASLEALSTGTMQVIARLGLTEAERQKYLDIWDAFYPTALRNQNQLPLPVVWPKPDAKVFSALEAQLKAQRNPEELRKFLYAKYGDNRSEGMAAHMGQHAAAWLEGQRQNPPATAEAKKVLEAALQKQEAWSKRRILELSFDE